MITITVDDSVSNAVAVVPNQHIKTHTQSRPDGDRELLEERVFPTSTMTGLVGHEFYLFGDTSVPKEVIDQLHMIKYVFETERYDGLMDEVAIYSILDVVADKTELLRHYSLLAWLGTKSLKDQKAAISTLFNNLKQSVSTKFILPNILENGKKERDISYVLALAVEREWWLSISTSEMYHVLGISSDFKTDEDFVKELGPLLWGKFDHIGKEDFVKLMLTKMRERSRDEIMWTNIIYKMRSDKSVIMPCDELLNELLRTYDTNAGALPIDAVRILTEFDLFSIYRPAVTKEKSVEMLIRERLLQLSPDELMWAKVIFMLQDDESASKYYPSVFDQLFLPSVLDKTQHSPSQAFTYLTSPDFLLGYESVDRTEIDDNVFLLEKLLGLSKDAIMWAKVMYMLQNDKRLSVIPSLLNNLIDAWSNFGAHTEQISLEESLQVLDNIQFLALSSYDRFISDNPDAHLLEILRMRSTDEVTWARALYYQKKIDEKSLFLFSAAGKNRILISAYELIRESEPVIKSRKPTLSEVNIILGTLHTHSKDDLMWARFLYKLKQDTTVNVVVSKVFDILLRTEKSAHTPSVCIAVLTSPSFSSKVGLIQLKEFSVDEVMWAKLLYMLGSSKNEHPNSLHNLLLRSLQEGWRLKGHITMSNINSFLKSASFRKMIKYAKFSSDNPSVFLLKFLQKQTGSSIKLASQLYNLRKSNNVLDDVLCALFQSWIGKPSYADMNSEEFTTLKTAFDLLMNGKLWSHWQLDDEDKACSTVLEELLKLSKDILMWYRFLCNLRQDSTFGHYMNKVVLFLLRIWKHELSV
ncbi:hypothetical protein Plhal304r1_c029g0095621 [Plasmopara halstedii]